MDITLTSTGRIFQGGASYRTSGWLEANGGEFRPAADEVYVADGGIRLRRVESWYLTGREARPVLVGGQCDTARRPVIVTPDGKVYDTTFKEILVFESWLDWRVNRAQFSLKTENLAQLLTNWNITTEDFHRDVVPLRLGPQHWDAIIGEVTR